eukprot:TRINITY_DN13379_c0_g1_i1.p1 TRINITY_DN13379_c0_g1~~TRINITY_DN13379_c0_g1_i1.p1  ORF type:complete len:330 (+),score=47.98 TRINITY_DN13379_c0_g1_i1:28-990(+)
MAQVPDDPTVVSNDGNESLTKVSEKIKKKTKDVIGQRMKNYEQSTENYLNPTEPYILRLDGHCFSSFTKPFKSHGNPSDIRVHQAMIKTCVDLLHHFQVQTVYTQSDEITLVFSAVRGLEPTKEETVRTFPFGGRVQKYVSLAASFCSVRFNYHLNSLPFTSEEQKLQEKVRRNLAYFDGRAFNVPSEEEAMNNVLWRSSYDCERNSTSMLAQSHFSHKVIRDLSCKQLRIKLKEELGVAWEDQPNWFKHGTLIKKETFLKEANDFHSGLPCTVTRHRIVARSFPLRSSPDLQTCLMAKTWNVVDQALYSQSDDDEIFDI